MFRISKIISVSALVLTLSIVCCDESAFARGGHGGGGRGGHGGGGRGGRAHSMSRSRGSRSTRSSRGRSNRTTYASNQQHNKQHNQQNSKQHNKQHNKQHKKHHDKHHHRHHGGYGWGDGMDGDGGDGGDDDGSDGASDASGVAPVVVPAPITILNPAETGRPVSYMLGSEGYSIEPAQSQAHNDGTQVITFDRGKAPGQATYTLQPGTYRFVMTQSGWDLRTVAEVAAQTSDVAG